MTESMTERVCPICSFAAVGVWVDERKLFLFQCELCTDFTITAERTEEFRIAWRDLDKKVLMHLDRISGYLRRAGDDDDRDITIDTWLDLSLEGQSVDTDEDRR